MRRIPGLAVVGLIVTVQGAAAQFSPRMEAPSVVVLERLQPGPDPDGGWNSHVVVISGDLSLRETLRFAFDAPAAQISDRTDCDWLGPDDGPCGASSVSHRFLGNPNLALTLGSVWMPVSMTVSYRPSLFSYDPGDAARAWTAGEAVDRARAADFGDRGYAFIPGLSVAGLTFEVNDEGAAGHGAAATAGFRRLNQRATSAPGAEAGTDWEVVGTFRSWFRFDLLTVTGSVRYQAVEVGSGLAGTQYAELGLAAEYEFGRFSPTLAVRMPLRGDYRGVDAPPFGLSLGVRTAVSAVY